jgi:uncharacterized phage infection (PIP) family protein YhgE
MDETPKKSQDEQNDDAILDRILGDDIETQTMTEPTDIPKVDEGDEEEGAAPAGEIESAPSTESPDVDSVLKRDNVPPEFIEALTEKFGAEAVTEWASKAAKRQTDVDSFSEQMRQLREQISDIQNGGNTADEAQTSGNTETDANPEASNHDDLGQVAEMFGDELADPLKKTRSQLTKLESSLQQIRQEAEIREAVAYAIGDEAVARGGMSPEDRQKVVAKANAIGERSPGSHKSVASLIQTAAKEVLGDIKPAPKATKPKEPQMTPPSATPVPEKPLTPEEEEDRILDGILGDWKG